MVQDEALLAAVNQWLSPLIQERTVEEEFERAILKFSK